MTTEDLASIRTQCVESIVRCRDYVLKYLDGDEKDCKITELKSYIEGYCSLDELFTSEDFKGRICEGERSIDDIFNKITALPPNSKHSNHEYMKVFLKKEKIDQNYSSKDEPDFAITSATQSLQDPITKVKIQIPMKNTVCGHLYDKESINHIMRVKRRAKCPYVGCSNKAPLSKRNLKLVPNEMSVESNSTHNIEPVVEVSDDDDEDMEIN